MTLHIDICATKSRKTVQGQWYHRRMIRLYGGDRAQIVFIRYASHESVLGRPSSQSETYVGESSDGEAESRVCIRVTKPTRSKYSLIVISSQDDAPVWWRQGTNCLHSTLSMHHVKTIQGLLAR